MARRVVDRIPAPDLDDAAGIHDRDAMRDMAHDRKIVGNEQIGEAEPALQVRKQVDDLGADRNVESGHRLVGDDEFGRHGQRTGDADALPLPAGECVRIALQGIGRQTDQLHERDHLVANIPGASGQPVYDQGLCHDIEHRHA
jgi:hypothetical protein